MSVLGACAVLAFSEPSHAQAAPGDEAVVIAAAVSHMIQVLRDSDGVPAGEIRFDPRVVQRRQIDHPAYSGAVTVYELSG
ncbi:hypothetical protein, partial [Longimicrobium sp.]|uniref:hypothetical protein n=1 Tax=Longimicrobium sp. TaxID=2029185 RepID=UPI002E34FF97